MAYAAWKRGIDGEKNDTFHPDDWEVRRRSDKTQRNGTRRAKSDAAEKTAREDAERRAEHAEACEKRAMKLAEIEREAREKAEADVEKLKEQLNKAKAKAKPGPTQTVDLLSCLLPGGVLDALSADEVAGKITAFWQEKGNRKHNETAQLDLVLGSTDHAAARNLARSARLPFCDPPQARAAMRRRSRRSCGSTPARAQAGASAASARWNMCCLRNGPISRRGWTVRLASRTS